MSAEGLDAEGREDEAHEHSERCGCRSCDPDFYLDRDEQERGTWALPLRP